MSPADAFEIDCPGCGKSMEFFKDETQRKCRNCGQIVKPSTDPTTNEQK